MNSPKSYKEILEIKPFVIVNIVGTSMLPLLHEGVDTVKVARRVRPLVRGDVVLFNRDSKLVLHRIIRVKKNKEETTYDICGDNQVLLEKNVPDSTIFGVMEGYYKKEEYIDISNKEYIKYYKKRMRNRILRKFKSFLSRLFK